MTTPARESALMAVIASMAGYFDKLSKLGNEPMHGNSDGNIIAQLALKEHAAIITEAQAQTKGGKDAGAVHKDQKSSTH